MTAIFVVKYRCSNRPDMNKNKNRLTRRQIKAIYCDRQRSQYQLAELYRVSQSTISLIRSGRRYAALTIDLPLYVRKDYRHTRSGRRKLTPPQVRDIYASLLPKRALVNAYGINRRTVERIRRGESHQRLLLRAE